MMNEYIVPNTRWPKGLSCLICDYKAKPGEIVLAKEHRSKGTLLLHKKCIQSIFQKSTNNTDYEDMIKEIRENNGQFVY